MRVRGENTNAVDELDSADASFEEAARRRGATGVSRYIALTNSIVGRSRCWSTCTVMRSANIIGLRHATREIYTTASSRSRMVVGQDLIRVWW